MTIQNLNGLTDEKIFAACPSVFALSKHDSRSDRYMYIPTSRILVALREVGFVPTTAMQARARTADRQEFTKHLLRLRKVADLGYGKPEVHEIVLVNSHDGSSAYNLYGGIFRLVCTNGLIRGDIDSAMKVYHKGNVVDQVVESTIEIAGRSEQVMEDIACMKRIQLSRAEQLLLSEFALKVRFDLNEGDKSEGKKKETIYQPADLLRVHRAEDARNDLFTTFNIIQENVIKGGVSRRDRKGKRHTTREIKNIDQNVEINRLLWLLAQKMMELK